MIVMLSNMRSDKGGLTSSIWNSRSSIALRFASHRSVFEDRRRLNSFDLSPVGLPRSSWISVCSFSRNFSVSLAASNSA